MEVRLSESKALNALGKRRGAAELAQFPEERKRKASAFAPPRADCVKSSGSDR